MRCKLLSQTIFLNVPAALTAVLRAVPIDSSCVMTGLLRLLVRNRRAAVGVGGAKC